MTRRRYNAGARISGKMVSGLMTRCRCSLILAHRITAVSGACRMTTHGNVRSITTSIDTSN